MEVIRKPQQIATEVISIRVTAGLKKEHAKARATAQRQDIDMTTMVTKALSEVFKSIEHASSGQPDGRKRLQQSLQNSVDEDGGVDNTLNNGGPK